MRALQRFGAWYGSLFSPRNNTATLLAQENRRRLRAEAERDECRRQLEEARLQAQIAEAAYYSALGRFQ